MDIRGQSFKDLERLPNSLIRFYIFHSDLVKLHPKTVTVSFRIGTLFEANTWCLTKPSHHLLILQKSNTKGKSYSVKKVSYTLNILGETLIRFFKAGSSLNTCATVNCFTVAAQIKIFHQGSLIKIGVSDYVLSWINCKNDKHTTN